MQMTPRTIIIAGLAVVLAVVAVVVFLPVAVFKPAPTITTKPYTALEQEGLELYKSNGCTYCHSQFTRPNDHSTSRPSRAGDYAYDKPHQLGTLRTGPDLANIGFKRGDVWEVEHLKYPRQYTPNSIMPSFVYLTDHQLEALVAYLNRMGSKRNASTDLMIPAEYDRQKQPFALTAATWDEGRRIYSTKCLSCHGCSGRGDGPYASMNNARPADLRQVKFQNRQPSFFLWRVSEGVPGTVMPQWEQTLSKRERWLVVLFIRAAFANQVPHLTDEGDMPAAYAKLNDPYKRTEDNIEAGKAIYVMNCAFCHGYGGMGDGPDARDLQPAPPNFHDLPTYQSWTGADYFWRVSESLPLRAMPQWKYSFNDQQRWLVSNYVRDVLIFPPANAEPADPVMPAAVKKFKIPADADIMRGREVYLKRCWMCHGDAGQSDGPAAAILRPVPVNFTDGLKDTPDADLWWRITAGIGNSAMPQWGLLLTEEERWDALLYVRKTFIEPSEPKDVSDALPIEYQALEAPWPDSAAAKADGKVVYNKLCAGCHGTKGLGDGPNGAVLMPTPANLAQEPAGVSPAEWWYWRIDQGVVGFDGKLAHPTAMPAWTLILTDQEKWNVIYYARDMVKAKDSPAAAPAAETTKGAGN